MPTSPPVAPSNRAEAVDLWRKADKTHSRGAWTKAAIAWVSTYEPKPGRRSKTDEASSDEFPMTFVEFANLGIPGLSSRDSVRKYRAAWVWAIDEGLAEEFKAGDEYALPSISWDEYPGPVATSSGASKPDTIERVEAALKAALKQYREEHDEQRQSEMLDRLRATVHRVLDTIPDN